MAFLNEEDANYLREKLAELLANPVQVRLFTEPTSGLYVPGRRTCETCADAEALMHELAELSDKIHLEIVDVSVHRDEAQAWGIQATPTIAVGPEGGDSGVRFQGLPDGYEFSSFVETLVSAGSPAGHGLQAETLEKLADLPGDVEIKTFVTPT